MIKYFYSRGEVVAFIDKNILVIYEKRIDAKDNKRFAEFIMSVPTEPKGYRITNVFEEKPEYAGKYDRWDLLNPHVDVEEVW